MEKGYVCINCQTGKEKDIVDTLNQIKGITEAHGTLGVYDIIARVESGSMATLNDDIITKIRKINGITSTMTLLGFDKESLPDLIPDVIPEERKPIEPHDDYDEEEEEEEEYDDGDDDYEEKK